MTLGVPKSGRYATKPSSQSFREGPTSCQLSLALGQWRHLEVSAPLCKVPGAHLLCGVQREPQVHRLVKAPPASGPPVAMGTTGPCDAARWSSTLGSWKLSEVEELGQEVDQLWNPVWDIAEQSIRKLSWYFSGISRTQAQQLLLSPANAPGAFLIRPSESSIGGYSLSVRAPTKVCHYRICMAPSGGLYLQEGRLFPSLDALLDYYKTNWKLIQNPLLQPCIPQMPLAQDEWERPRSEFVLRRKLGEGFFGEVWEGLWLGSMPVAVKVIKSADMKLADLTKEIEALKSLRHERLIRLHAICSLGEPVYIVTELMGKGNLQVYLGSPEGKALNLPHLLGFACQVAEGMSYLEERRVVHRDLAARNVLVGDDLTCKVADFGLARLLKDDVYSPSSGSKIPVKWTAPEAANYRVFSQKSDVWSFGILLYEVFTYGQCPYEGMTNHETLQQISRGYRLPRPAACPAEVYVLMVECWKSSPEERPTFATLREKLNTIHRRLHLSLT
ncbi:tyrosine-protein kinase Srms [Alexandromys fortis]|uniref:tyrosine-protein kinase Srms n=1 Tax=Alexandromys fortis TaxID=100897 RepID=UPI00215345A2|nr:tyrosine-protein kinase Srms [Microtus fortis]